MPAFPVFDGIAANSTELVTSCLIAAQLIALLVCYWKTLRPLGSQRKLIVAQRASAFARPIPEERASKKWPEELLEAWARLHPADGTREVSEPLTAFESQRMLPVGYNARLDMAAPGLFTGLGIFGTFVGLFLAFGSIDPAQSANSIQPLIAGMRVAFINSLVGVGLALCWTFWSRDRRHAFDAACKRLAREVATIIGRHSAGDQVLAAFRGLQTSIATDMSTMINEIRVLGGATSRSSADLLDKLAPTIERSFQALLDTPFERLDAAVASFATCVEDASQMQREVAAHLATSVSYLSQTKSELAATLEIATSNVQAFKSDLGQWAEQARTAADIVTQSKSAAESLTATANTIRSVGERHGQLASALGGTVTELRSLGGTITATASQFQGASDRLEGAASRIETLSTRAAEEAAASAQVELQRAVRRMADALQQFGAETAAKYEESTRNVVNTVDNKMSDLTDRLSAELTTLTARLPEAMEQLTDATREVLKQVRYAVRGLDEAVRELDTVTKQSLDAQLRRYDEALAVAVDRFSGTLSMWDGKVSDLAAVSLTIRTTLEHGKLKAIEAQLPIPAVAQNVSATS
jgi:hypothetical protein